MAKRSLAAIANRLQRRVDKKKKKLAAIAKKNAMKKRIESLRNQLAR
jgi:hypothetical protein